MDRQRGFAQGAGILEACRLEEDIPEEVEHNHVEEEDSRDVGCL